jgi:sulfoxide reductase catalytic subunit YedY
MTEISGGGMLIKVTTGADVPSSEITPEHVYRSRREFMRLAGAGVVGAAAGSLLAGCTADTSAAQATFANVTKSPLSTRDAPHTWAQITSYNNYYEFGTDKDDPARYAQALTVKPWTVKVDGLVNKPGDYGVEDLVDFNQLEERVYRLRCVEAWSMVIPWIGVPLSAVLGQVDPQPGAKFVEFTTAVRPTEMPFLNSAGIDFPYIEGLRMDEAMHPLTLMVVGLYGKVLPNQNGAPLRVHIPWKYGFKSGKSIVKIRLVSEEPKTTWNRSAPNEYGFYSNVNPTVDHPRWSQATERRIGEFRRRKTLMFNGYADQVASLYSGMDLKKHY